MIVYKEDMLELLKEKGYTTYELMRKKDPKTPCLIGSTQLQKFRRGERIGMDVLDTVCRLTGRQPGDLIGYIEDEQYDALLESGYFKDKGIPASPRKKDK